MSTDPLLKNLLPDRQVSLCTVVCFPYAGGGARVFRDWPRRLSPLVSLYAVQLPGREERRSQAPVHDAERVVADLCSAIEPLREEKVVLFGHSLGAVLAARVAQELFADRSAADALLVVSGRRSPWSGPRTPSARGLTDEELVEAFRAGGGERAQLAADPDFARLMLPALKADLQLADAASRIRERSMSIPVIGLYGTHDTGTPLHYVRPWSRVTTGGFRTVEIDGDHYFAETRAADVVAVVDAAARSLTGL
ncbi:alpha/beta fold hydrolase [Streptomyces sp. FXJ1.172]|uniref:thioesterase II family protein n=1 Tax=Streptomyces sp. FXJ1.172 TaxID=710705 RepID=UPI0007D00336|nr:alpha/beta fold hydrolase [Streptomyces sp. FXJ1.172]WEO95425.1 alpha/beta fold hydrolase [Streptomyces sp. FXJ1.172]